MRPCLKLRRLAPADTLGGSLGVAGKYTSVDRNNAPHTANSKRQFKMKALRKEK
jgi:hypothetical protein